MSSTTIAPSPLAVELEQSLTSLGFRPDVAAEITDLVPPAGRNWLLNRINATPHPLRELQQIADRVHRDTLAVWLRASTADTETVTRRLREATR
ncbi:hypothetical protein GCM10010172_07170 [Paractinoplanes ferrugineus]|uniref:Uncharacterized protein n=1 Tax=Paractinoplanes ferrugineus TaxID=113564 RepID=A0A919MJ77_9ACTN|nr:hypothetical protein [Actinoplanes ferrugineus]GIE16804.1 hypothetical protein Afe05nite_86440 [Actinoplanes ferrugineus]